MQYYPMGFRPKELSVRTAMKEIAESKVAMAQADMAPTLVEKTKKLWEWEQKDRPLTRELKEQAITKGRQDIATTERAKLLKAMSDARDILTWANEATTDEEFNKRLESAKPVYSKEHKDYVTGEGGEDLIDLNKITRESAQTTLGWLDEKTNTIMKPGDTRITERGGEIISQVQAAFKPEEGPYKEGEIKDFKEGDQFIQKKFTNGEWVPTGVEAPRYKPGVTINMPDTVTPSMKTKLQTEMFEHQQAIDRLDQIEALTKDEYLTYYGKGKAKVSEMLTKAGMSTEDMKKTAADYEEWVSATKVHTLLWRKLITGVAGGEKEMKAIEETTINVGDSAPSFRRKLSRQKIMAEAALQRAQFSIEHFGSTFKDLTNEQKADVQKRFPFVAAAGGQDADALLKELGYE